MSWRQWAETLRQTPLQAVTDLLRGAADVTPYERAAPHEFPARGSCHAAAGLYGNDCWENLTAQGRKRISIYQPAWMPA
jgi:hypothetical protein